MTTDLDHPDPSLLASLMDWMQAATPMCLSFEDLSGITYDYPQLFLPERLRRHVLPFCDCAKHNVRGALQCSSNKSLGNRLAIEVGEQCAVGCCYLGLTDICRVLRYQDRDMGVFFFGSVIRKGQLDQARQRIRTVCQGNGKVTSMLLRRLPKVPVVTDRQITDAITRIEQLVQAVEHVLAGLAIPAGIYETYSSNSIAAQSSRQSHPLVQRTLRLIHEQHAQPLTLAGMATQLRCHPGYLGRLFKQQVGQSVSDYLRQTRINRACRLLQIGHMDVNTVGMEVGYEDKSNFGRAFRHLMHMSPGQFRDQHVA